MTDTYPAKSQSPGNPSVSVIVPTFNSARFFPACLQSIADQNYPNIETLVVDSFSTDETAKIAREHGAKVISFKGTQAAARNVGIAKSKGEFVLFLDSDQRLERGTIEECARICLTQSVEAVKIPEFSVGLDVWGKCSALWKNNQVEDVNAAVALPRFYKKSKLQEQGCFVEDLCWWEDQELYRRLRASGLKEAWSTQRVLHYESDSAQGTIRKYWRYGRSAVTAGRSETQAPETTAFFFTVSALKQVIQNPKASAGVVCGCLFLFAVRSLSGAIGYCAGLTSK